ncbi:AAA family ATPase [Proteinivorax tanatarense]|uniref:AAA family ATPase n=1 Tax=Proteinivorax tanatarense TaxID=1260629 RepID=A0AAU7VL61_9FIRM
MKVTDIYVSGFGIHKELEINNLSPRTNIFYGKNEKGKTTLKKFISSIFFGFENRNKIDRYNPINGGRYGGYIDISTENQTIRVKRIDNLKGKSAVKEKLDVLSGKPVKNLTELLPPGLNKKTFESIFCFGIDQLQNFKSLNKEEVTGYLQGAGFGVDVSSIIQHFTKEMEQLYTPKGRKKKINYLFNQLDEVKKELEKAKKESENFYVIEDQILEVEKQLESKKKKRDELAREINKLEKLQRIQPSYLTMLEVENKLKKMPSDELDFSYIRIAREQEEEIEAAQLQLDDLIFEQQKLEIELSEQQPNKQLLAMEAEIKKVEMSLELAKKKSKLIDLENKVKAKKEEIASSLKKVGFSKDIDSLLHLDFELLFATFETLKEENNRLLNQKEYIMQQKDLANKKINEISTNNDEETYRIEKELFLKLQRLKQQAKSTSVKTGYTYSALAAGVVIIAMFASYLNVFSVMGATILAVAAGICFVIAFALEVTNGLKSKKNKNIINSKINKISEQLNVSPDEHSLIGLHEKLMNMENSLKEKKELLSQINNFGEKEKNISAELMRLNKKKEEMLVNIHLNPQMSFDEARSAIATLQRCQHHMYQCRKDEIELGDAKALEDDFIKKVAKLAEEIKEKEIPSSLDESIVVLKILKSKLDNHKDIKENKSNLEKQMGTLKQKKQILEQQIKKKQNKLSNLYNEAKVTSLYQLEQMYTKSEEKRRLLNELNSLELEISLSSLEKDQIEKELGDKKGCDLEEEVVSFKEHKKQLDKEIDFLLSELGKNKNQLEIIKKDKTIEDLQYKQEGLNSQLAEEISQYYEMAIAKKILENATESHRHKRQPEVLKRTSSYFNIITGGRYIKVISDDEQSTLKVIDEKREKLSLKQLSRGTQEQLLLAVRMALAIEFARSNKPMPLIVDDVMVNFDKQRRREMIKVFEEISKEVQVLFFTCHDYMVDEIENQFKNEISIVSL